MSLEQFNTVQEGLLNEWRCYTVGANSEPSLQHPLLMQTSARRGSLWFQLPGSVLPNFAIALRDPQQYPVPLQTSSTHGGSQRPQRNCNTLPQSPSVWRTGRHREAGYCRLLLRFCTSDSASIIHLLAHSSAKSSNSAEMKCGKWFSCLWVYALDATV